LHGWLQFVNAKDRQEKGQRGERNFGGATGELLSMTDWRMMTSKVQRSSVVA
jgi:hypothetical protein